MHIIMKVGKFTREGYHFDDNIAREIDKMIRQISENMQKVENM